jgi:hypothetical protein
MNKNKGIVNLTAAALGLVGTVLLTAPVAQSAPPDWNLCTNTSDPVGCLDEKVRALSDIQPGLGTVMIEYGNRFTNMYYAAKARNWGLAAYMMKEAKEIQEVGETTRPANAGALIWFEQNLLTPIDDAIIAQDFRQFRTAFSQAEEGCNSCHASKGYPFIQYRLPEEAPAPLRMWLGNGHDR